MILTCAELCKLSYRPRLPDGFKDVEDLRYGITEHGGVTIVTIRGTDNVENWLRDADVIPKRTCAGYIAHAGFIRAFRKLCSGGMLNDIPKDKPVIATGHSLGGAVATLLAEHLNCELVTFGSPRVYFRFFSYPMVVHSRYICDDDPVPMVPRIMYRHTCNPTVLRDKDSQLIDVKDHSMGVYLQRIRKGIV